MDSEEASEEEKQKIWSRYEADFKKRLVCFHDFAKANPNATIEELSAYRQKIAPSDPLEAKAFSAWCVLEIHEDLSNG